MKKMIILKKIRLTIEYHSIIFQPFQFEPEQKKTFESHEKETKHIYDSAADLVHIRIGNLNWCKWGRKTKREKWIVFVVERWMQCLLL